MAQHLSVMVVGSGAREHALSQAYEKSSQVSRVIVAPGNDFIAYLRKKEVLIDKGCSLTDPFSILSMARKYRPDLVDVAQDDALASGTVDLLQEQGFQAFGPTKMAARIEWDKKWSREFMLRHQIPSPKFRYFDSAEDALKSTSLDEAVRNIGQMKHFPNQAGMVFLVEDGLIGEEFSYYTISDGQTYRAFKSAQDNKAVFNFDEGGQTGGMGAISPAKATNGLSSEIEENFISKAIDGMAAEEVPYLGILYLGGIVVDGKPINIEYNAR